LLVMITGLVAFFAAGIVTPSWAPLLQATVSLGLSAAFFGAAAVELLQRPRAHLRTRWPLVGFLVVHTIVFAIGGAEAALDVFPASGIVTFGIWFGVIHFEQLIFSLASSIFAVAIVRERSELRHRIAAHVDVLTGVASRRAFFESAAAALRHCEEEDSPFSLVIVDLDRFKQVNDTFGHAAGDQVLQLFCRTAVARIRRGDIIGRLGGEEFAVAMPGASPEAAYVVADRIRQAFATADLKFNGRAVATMASGGVAAAHPLSTLDELIEQADAALYRAKSLGRDRIEMTNRPQESDDSAAVIRVA
jgi:diguanylate cyclase (GGDEF)-like protein